MTFERIIPKIKNSLNFWKPFKLCTLSKARVIEIFHASRLWYAARFYRIPPPQVEILQRAFLDYINFPHKQTTVSQTEMQKLKIDGGIKLVSIQVKSEASKIKWLISLCTNPELSLHKALMERLLGVQRGGLSGIDLFFTTKSYATRILKIEPGFYREAIAAMTTLECRKKLNDRYQEKVFYNKMFLKENGDVLSPNKTCIDKGVFIYEQFIMELGADQGRKI